MAAYRSSLVAIMLAGILMAAGGCNVLVSEHPIGEPVTASSKLNLDGLWQHGKHTVAVKQLEDGTLHVASLQWADGEFQMEQYRFLLTEHDDAYYLNHQHTDDNTQRTGYSFSRLVLDQQDDALLLIPANVRHFADAIEAGELAGEVLEHDQGNTITAHVQADKPAIDAYIDSDRLGEQFQPHRTTVVRRVGDLPAPPSN